MLSDEFSKQIRKPKGFDKEIVFITGQRGARKILCDGFTYICAKTIKNRKYWVCAKQRSKNCKARLITDINESFFVLRNSVHIHAPESSRYDINEDKDFVLPIDVDL